MVINSVSTLIDDLEGSMAVRDTARRRLMALGEAALPALIAVVTEERGRAAVEAVRILRELRDPRAFDALAGAVRSKNPLLSGVAVEALTQFGDPNAGRVLLNALPDASVMTQQSIILTLQRLHCREAVPRLVTILQQTDLPLIRCAIIQALAELGDASLVSVIRPYEEDADHHVRDWAAQAVHQLQGN